ncbi:hypothetical protein BU15DRAFT_66662 [Melanogaster broomeanus]|nr:hypothetical protein BU15DRAFT_66662 [Melanogaster broomeanus]
MTHWPPSSPAEWVPAATSCPKFHCIVLTLTRQFTTYSSPRNASTSKQPHVAKTSGSDETEQKIHRAQVNSLLFGADRLLNAQNSDALKTYFMDKLSEAKFYNTYRSTAFMRSIRFCLERHTFGVAIALYDEMLHEGFIAVYSLCIRMTALKIVEHSTKLRETVDPLKEIFADRAYDISAFMDLAFVLIRAIKLSDCPDLVGELASINMRANRLDAAQNWLQVFEQICSTEGTQPDPTPYSDIINTLNDIDPENSEAIQAVLLRMKSAGVPPDIAMFNTLIRVNLAQQRHKEAFALYHVLIQKGCGKLIPNDVTFKMFFRAAQLTRKQRVRRYRRPDNAVAPRGLFREMLESHLQQTEGQALGRSTVLSVSAFHIALRTFMALEDYAAAFIVIRALHTFGFQPNLQTYLIVIINLLYRMKRELAQVRKKDEYRLADFLVHLRPDEDPDLDIILDRIRNHQPVVERTGTSSVGVETIAHLLSLGDDHLPPPRRLPLHKPVYADNVRRSLRSGMITGADPVRSDMPVFFSPTPLACMLQKALLGELSKKALHRGPDWDWKGAAGPILRETKEEMVPADFIEGSKETEETYGEEGGIIAVRGVENEEAKAERERWKGD